YSLPEYALTLPYRPGDFTQVNPAANALLVARAMQLLQPQPGERIADLFCGLGNFSLPIAAGAQVIGIEGSPELTERASQNARLNHLAERARFHSADLFQTTEHTVAGWGYFDKILLDPPRSGAYALVQALHAPYLPRRIVYVSCNPATFARDAAVLVGKGYRFRNAGIVNMFPQTAHVETVGCFDLE
ncbi:methyltransferase domain-containing protein, partial [Eikenella corrodens]